MFKSNNSIAGTLSLIAVACLLQSQLVPKMAMAAGTAVLAQDAITKSVADLETRFFSRQYVNDPLEKRLERLELMVFGATQGGENGERYARLKKAVADRAKEQQSAPTGAKSPSPTAAAGAGAGSQYPAVKALEMRAFKKSYVGEPLDQRLSRLEKKVFGAPSPAMAYADRVDRLKKIMAAGDASSGGAGGAVRSPLALQPRVPGIPLGPMPKARGRGQGGGAEDLWSFNAPGDDFFNDGMGGGNGFSFGFGGSSVPGLPSTINKMLKEMDRQMSMLDQMPIPNGGSGSFSYSFEYDPKTGAWIDRSNGKPVKPGAPGAPRSLSPRGLGDIVPPTFKAPRAVPRLPMLQRDTELPPYSDPNSI